MSLSKNFKELFKVPDEKSEEWDDKLFELAEKGLINELEQHINTANEIFFDENRILTAISDFTKKTVSQKEKIRLLKSLKEDKLVKNFIINDSTLIIYTSDFEIRVGKLSDIIVELKQDSEIETDDREGKCHTKSIEISERLGIINDIVTGYIFGYSDKAKYLHSWVEFSEKGKEFVIDYTKNIMINKEAYYKLMHVIPLSRISDTNIKEDKKILFKHFSKLGQFNIKEYLVFRDEIMKGFEKNIELFEEER